MLPLRAKHHRHNSEWYTVTNANDILIDYCFFSLFFFLFSGFVLQKPETEKKRDREKAECKIKCY